jgi:uncharacterized protein YndB with AHSA1/START domain
MSRDQPIYQTVTLRCSPKYAFEVFTDGMGTWWPVDSYSRAYSEFGGAIRCVRLEFQPRLGGSIIEHLSDGTALPWATVTAWDPPHRVVMAWRPHAQPEPPTEVEVTFTPQGDGTRVELEHRDWDRLSDQFGEALYDTYARGWITTLELFVAAADREIP